jgi:Zn-dependent peptidase ImmA (M78 family)
MTVRVEIDASMLAWAMERSGRDLSELIQRFPRLSAWERGDSPPTLKQLEDFARATRTPLGYLLLPEPPTEEVPLPDFRTQRDTAVQRASPDLLDTIALCQERQDWYRSFTRRSAAPPLGFIGSLTTAIAPADAAALISAVAGFDLVARREYPNWTEALRGFVGSVEDAGVLVMTSGVVGSNTRRKLDPDEFRGFALVDGYAPVVFINGADSKAAQIFTLAHELAHLWLGESALDNPRLGQRSDNATERWCNAVAAELLVPSASLRQEFNADEELSSEVGRLARFYRVSTLVVLHSLFDTGIVAWQVFTDAYDAELQRITEVSAAGGGDFYRTQRVKVSPRFARAVIESTLEGDTLYRDAFRLLGVRKQATFDEFSQRLGVA